MNLEEKVVGGSPGPEAGTWEKFVWCAESGGEDLELVCDQFA